jgi:hypothetical protein
MDAALPRRSAVSDRRRSCRPRKRAAESARRGQASVSAGRRGRRGCSLRASRVHGRRALTSVGTASASAPQREHSAATSSSGSGARREQEHLASTRKLERGRPADAIRRAGDHDARPRQVPGHRFRIPVCPAGNRGEGRGGSRVDAGYSVEVSQALQDVEPFSGHAPQQERPLGGYAALIGAFATLAAGFGAWLRASGRDLPERMPPGDLALITVATHKASRLVAKDRVTSSVRHRSLASRATPAPVRSAKRHAAAASAGRSVSS